MVNYIKTLTEELIFILELEPRQTNAKNGLNIFDYFKMIAEETDNLETVNFDPDKRYDFIITREKLRKLSTVRSTCGLDFGETCFLLRELIEILNSYGNFNSGKPKRSFNFLHDHDLKGIVERDYAELSSVLLPDGAWKSTVIIAGSILEAVLYDVLINLKYNSAAIASTMAPKYKGKLKDLSAGKWTLEELILVAEDIGLLPPQRVSSIDQVLRDYRNFVHPKKEIKSQHPCTEAEAFMSKGALDAVCNHLETVVKEERD